ncbi:MAG TPA: LacI family DNA-binding transcriptional regulator, partial [Candidatus Goldiibacteriota bacterium]|nr:LacI family DNA-binding transcriptional regulator [Candidatus Goldiibacteriota bacterium]
MKKRPTLEDVAKKAGVTAATVSLAINNNPRIPEDTREMIKKAAKALNYVPNAAARSLAAGKSDSIAIAAISFSAWYEMALMRGIESVIHDSSYSMVQYSTWGSREKERELLKTLMLSQKAAGLIGFSFVPGLKKLAEMKKRKFPFVSVGEKAPGFCSVVFNDFRGAFMAAERLARAGRKNIAIINQRMIRGYTARDVREKLRGFNAAIDKYGLKRMQPVEVENVYFSDGIKACDRISAIKGIDAVFCAAGDNTAAGFIKRARELKISVPDDI